MILMSEQIEFIARVTKALNELGEPPDGFYLQVHLTDSHDHTSQGCWVDEFGSDAWYFDTDPPKKEVSR